MHEVFSCGFPHSDTCGSLGVCPSPQLFAAYHVFLRLLVPRHPPCALVCLTSSLLFAGFRCIALQLLLSLFLFLDVFPFSRFFLLVLYGIFKVHVFSFYLCWQPPAFPCRLQHSILGRLRLNHRVRDGYGCVPQAHRHQLLLLPFRAFLTSLRVLITQQ